MGDVECWHFFDEKQRFEYKRALEWRATEQADDSVMFSTESTGGLEVLLAEYQILSNWKTSYLVFVMFNYQRILRIFKGIVFSPKSKKSTSAKPLCFKAKGKEHVSHFQKQKLV